MTADHINEQMRVEMENSAERLRALLSQVRAAKDDTGAIEMWAKVFGIASEDSHSRSMEVAQRLVWVDDELAVLVEALKQERDYPEEGYATMQQGVQRALGLGPLNNKAVHVKQHLGESVMTSLQQMAINLARTEIGITEEQLTTLSSLIDSLAQQLTERELEPALRGVVLRHIRLLRRAIDAYPIWGVRAFSDSLRDALGDLMIFRERQANGPASPEEQSALHALKSAWKKVSQFVTEADKVRKTVVLVGAAYEALEWGQQHLR